MAVDVRTDVVIERPRHEVAAFAANPDNAPGWYVNIKRVEWQTPPPVAPGSRVAFVAEFIGRRLAYTYEIVELVPDERLVMRTAEGPFPMETTYMWEAIGDARTRMTLRNPACRAGSRGCWRRSWVARCAARTGRIWRRSSGCWRAGAEAAQVRTRSAS